MIYIWHWYYALLAKTISINRHIRRPKRFSFYRTTIIHNRQRTIYRRYKKYVSCYTSYVVYFASVIKLYRNFQYFFSFFFFPIENSNISHRSYRSWLIFDKKVTNNSDTTYWHDPIKLWIIFARVWKHFIHTRHKVLLFIDSSRYTNHETIAATLRKYNHIMFYITLG